MNLSLWDLHAYSSASSAELSCCVGRKLEVLGLDLAYILKEKLFCSPRMTNHNGIFVYDPF